ncbi:hypothetical protein NDU88_005545 [Pleurodeles waltl]|uniref:UBA domain-containing protein n=2 Tax=Pleurodeles waltl TaxID=8319 RepID=A0AAV7LXM0_PLEWA|nr:hypothetical protein NDU88_005545 [Pleurodeles waltl]
MFTYPVCPPGTSFLFLDLLIFVVIGWKEERALGTLPYLQRTVLVGTTSAALYLVLALLLFQSPVGVCGYTTIHIGLLAARPFTRRIGVLGRVVALALPSGIILFTSLLFHEPPILLYMCGLLTGLFYSTGALSWLEMTEQTLEQLEYQTLCHTLAGNPFFHFVPSLRREWTLPHTDPLARERLFGPEVSHCPSQGLTSPFLQSSSGVQDPLSSGPDAAYNWMQQPPLQVGEQLHTPVHQVPPWVPPVWHADVPLTVLERSLMEEEMLQAGIAASLQQSELEDPELKLPKSSVSALRLQQLERMGFSTQQAVVALAATGKVEGAVSLLVGGQVGGDAMVTTDARLHFS